MIRLFVLFCLISFSGVLSAVSIQKDESLEIQQKISYSAESKRYGDWLFEGGFVKHAFSGIDPKYRISHGDTLIVQLWGGVDYQAQLNVDPQGNVFLPKVGPIKVIGVNNSSLNEVVLNSVKRVYKKNVQAYVSLLSTQKVKVFLSGLVNKPGLYEGQSADSILRFIDLAGGIRNDIGSMRDIHVKRNGNIVYEIDLYDFIQNGSMPAIQLHDGDVIFVGTQKGSVVIEGNVGFEGQYELKGNDESLKELISAVVVDSKATHITLIEPININGVRKIEANQYRIEDLLSNEIKVKAGTLVKVSSQMRAESISVELVGEHNSEFEMVLPWGASLADLLAIVKFSPLSNRNAVQLFRKSVSRRQKDMLHASLSSLEQSVLTARSETNEAAQLRATEAKSILQWIDKARSIEPKGQVLLSEGYEPENVILQQGDRVAIPAIRNLVLVHGQVLFPTAIAYNKKFNAEDYIDKAGGATEDIEEMNVLVMKPNGDFIDANDHLDDSGNISPGDEIFVLAKPEVKSIQLTKDIMQVLYQIAVSAAVVLSL